MVAINDNAFVMDLSVKQTHAWDATENAAIDALLYGGAKGGGKSVFGCFRCFEWAKQLITTHNIKPRKHPIPVGFMGRKQSVDFNNTTLETWKRFIPPEFYHIRSQEKEILIGDTRKGDFRVKIDYGGLDRTETINKFNSAEYGFIFLDQAEEITKDEVSVLRGSLRLKIHGKWALIKQLYTANPANCWLKTDFIDNCPENYKFVQALPTDNPWLGEKYIQVLKEAFGHRKELLEAYLHGSWRAMDAYDQVIKDAWLRAAAARTLYPPQLKKLLTCDVARFGDDETVIYYMENTDIIEEKIYGKKDTMYTANILHVMSHKKGGIPIVVDEGGVGGGTVDRLREMGDEVIAVNSSEKADDTKKYYNRRAEIWDRAGQMLCEGDVELQWQDELLKNQLCAPKYKFRNGRILIEPKEEIKDRLGRSPDRGDAYVNGLWAMEYVPSETDRNTKKRRKNRRKRSAMAV